MNRKYSTYYNNYIDDITPELFNKCYKLIDVYASPEEKMRHKPQRERVCRFCQKEYNSPETSFRKDAHIIPEFLGNRYLTSDFECDDCNSKFSRLENDLKCYLGIVPAITKTIGKKNKVKKFKSYDKGITVQISQKLKGDFIEIIQDGVNGSLMDNKGNVNILYLNNFYTPQNVYKALLKIALSTLPDNLLPMYRNTFKLLNSLRGYEFIAKINVHKFPLTYTYSEPLIFLYEKVNILDPTPFHVMILYYRNIIIQLPIPLFTKRYLLNIKPYLMPILPPMHNNKKHIGIKYEFTEEILASDEVLRNDYRNIHIGKIKPGQKFISYNPETENFEDLSKLPQSKLHSIIIVPKGTSFTLEDLRKDILLKK